MQGIVLPDACRCCFSFPESVVARRKEDKEIQSGFPDLLKASQGITVAVTFDPFPAV